VWIGVVIALCNISTSIAQPRTITGKVTFKDTKTALPGAKIIVKGAKRGGAISNKDGDYRIEVQDGSAIIVFSLIGHLSKEIRVGEQTVINTELELDDVKLEEVVVTALGIEQQKRAVNYAVQDVKAGEIIESQQQNVVNALQGRIAGVQITNAGGGPGASSSIIIRGGNSVDSDNQPLFIIDGVPMDNSTTTETGAGTSGLNGQLARSVSNSNRAIDLNPDDIENISILKGPSAAALYGSRAANGVVIITTKRGKEGSTNITYNNSFSYDVANRLPRTQSEYKQGFGGFYNPTTRLSWGSRFQPGDSVFENMDNFFVPAFSMTHNISGSGANETANYFFSINRTDQNGIVPLTFWDRTSLRFNGGAKVAENLRVQGSVTYTNSGGNRALQGPGLFGSSGGYLISMVYWPKNDNMRNWQNPDGTRRRLLAGDLAGDIDNPYFTVNRNTVNDNVNRFLGNVRLIYDPTDWLNITYIAGGDFAHEETRSIRAPGTSLFVSGFGSLEPGSISQGQNFNRILNSQLLVTFKKELVEGLVGELLLGNWIEASRNYQLDYTGFNFINKDFVSINNTVVTENRVVERITERRLLGLFAQANLSWQNKLFLSIRGRNDWSSTLPIDSRSYFYPAVDIGYVISEDLPKNDFLTYGKLRFSLARVGKDAAPYRTGTALTSNTYLGGGFRNDFWAGNPTLKPEITEAIELGGDFRLFNGAINVDAAVYRQTTYNQLIAPRISQASGFIFAYLNGGTVENQGLELALNGSPVRETNFTWNFGINFTANQSRVVELPSVLQELNQADGSIINVGRASSFPGQPLQAIAVTDYNRNPQGRIIIDSATGLPTAIASGTYIYGGNRQPDAIIGINNSFTFFNSLTFSFLWDIRIGGKVLNGTEWDMVRAGMSRNTLDRYKTAVLDGVIRNRAVADPNAPDAWIPNNRVVELSENYYRFTYAAAGTNFIEDGSWVRLRTVNLAYRLPKEIIRETPLKELEIFVTGRNLLLFTNYTGMDPEVSASGAGVRGAGTNGMDYGGVPATLGVTAGLKISF
jgi:TonB-linked SusC/RagA family outer membrane protein